MMPSPATPALRPEMEDLAQRLVVAWRSGGTVPLPADDGAPATRTEAFAVQDRIAALIGDRSVGWKVGAAIPAVRALDGTDDLTLGRLLAQRQHRAQARLPAAVFGRCKVECEIAFRFTRHVPARVTPFTRAELEPVLVLHPGLEIAGTRYALPADGRRPTPRDVIADNGAAAAYVEGDGLTDWRSIDLATLAIDARIDEGEPIPRFEGMYYRDPVEVLVDMANALRARGVSIAAGDLLSTGSLTIPVAMRPGQSLVARFGAMAQLRVALA